MYRGILSFQLLVWAFLGIKPPVSSKRAEGAFSPPLSLPDTRTNPYSSCPAKRYGIRAGQQNKAAWKACSQQWCGRLEEPSEAGVQLSHRKTYAERCPEGDCKPFALAETLFTLLSSARGVWEMLQTRRKTLGGPAEPQTHTPYWAVQSPSGKAIGGEKESRSRAVRFPCSVNTSAFAPEFIWETIVFLLQDSLLIT